MERNVAKNRVCGVILAGGLASRMNYLDKPLVTAANRSLIEYVIAGAQPQVSQLAISVNRNLEKYRKYALPLITDVDSKFSGPLVGIYSAMKWYKEHNFDVDFLACFPADVPIFPNHVIIMLKQAIAESCPSLTSSNETKVAWCQSGRQAQPLFSLWSFELQSTLEQAIQAGMYGPKQFFQNQPNKMVQLPESEDGMFLNINTKEDLIIAESLLSRKS